ncbi:MAG: aspartate-semialdehyde dehydrogenase [Peptococcaceae bacterium]|nr:aspartate-semialdehyde dehydrogenase [Peptococcaceae bacterium]
MNQYRIGVVGAMGAVGTEMLATLEKSTLPIAEVIPLDVKENEGKTVTFRGQPLRVKSAEKGAFKGIDIALFSAGETASLHLSPIAIEEGAVVIDNSNAFRMEPWVPLVVPEVNPEAAKAHKGLIANPNCSTIQMMVVLKPLHDRYKIKRIVVSTYQAVSGTGLPAIEELNKQVEAYVLGKEMYYSVYPYQIAFNALPHIDSFLDNGYTKEEMKMFNETRKILNDPEILVSPTAVRIPVFRCHSEAINIETEKPLPEIAEIVQILDNAPGVKVIDDVQNKQYPLPAYLKGTDKVYVGRIRKDFTVPHGLNLWVVADNLRKGAALNAVQIAELLVERNWLKGE